MEGTLVLLGLLALAFTWLTALWGIEALFGIVSTVALVLSWAMRRLRCPAEGSKLGGLRTVQAIRSQITSHSSGSRGAKLAKDALEEHGTYTAHFDSVCRNVIDELKVIEGTFS